MRPDRIVVGEVRRGEALDLIQSMISGHAGAMTTVHASSPFDAAVRLETLSLMSDVELPLVVARSQVGSALDLVVQITRLHDGTRRLKSITECLGLDKDNQYRFRDLFALRTAGVDSDGRISGELVATGEVPSFSAEPYEMGLASEIDLTKPLFREGG
jgi:pilus assembly protein CpaF